jgi:H+/gluconate symporter-like permease
MDNKLKPALIGGLVLGVLTAIPFVNLVNACCCCWAVLGGAIAVNLYIKQSPTPVSMGESALLGVMSGVIGTVVAWIIGIPLSLIIGDYFSPLLAKMFESIDPRAAEDFRRQLELQQNQPFIQKLPAIMVSMMIAIVVYPAFSTVGGLLGRAIFEKRKDIGPSMPPPPPPSYGGQPY